MDKLFFQSKKKKCKNQLNPADWNNVLTSILSTYNAEVQSAMKTLDIAIKSKKGILEKLGRVTVRKNHAKIQWKGSSSEEEEEEDEDDAAGSNNDDDDGDDDTGPLPMSFKQIRSKEKEKRSGCATTTKEIKMLHAEDDDEAARVLLTEMDESEWWTMVIVLVLLLLFQSSLSLIRDSYEILSDFGRFFTISGMSPGRNRERRRRGDVRRWNLGRLRRILKHSRSKATEEQRTRSREGYEPQEGWERSRTSSGFEKPEKCPCTAEERQQSEHQKHHV